MIRVGLSLLLLLLASPAASAQDPTWTWTVSLRGKPVGKETVTISVKGERRIYRATGTLKVTEKPFPFTHTLTVAAKGFALLEYSLDSTIVRAGAKPVPQGVELRTDYGPQEQSTKIVNGPRPRVVIDTLTYSQFDVLGRIAAGRPDTKPFTFLALTPQGARGAKATFTPAAKTFTIAIHGTPRTVRRGTLTVGKLKAVLVYDAQDGQAYRVEDSMGFLAVRNGWPAAPWREEEVVVPGLERGTRPLAATLTFPRQATRPPVVLLVADAGPQDRDETIGPNAPFRDLARGLAARGVATLRFDKRSFVLKRELSNPNPKLRAQARKRWTQITYASEYVDDAVSSLRWLRQRKDLGRVFVLGHGLGARAAIDAAEKFPALAGLILLGAGGRTRDVLIREESVYQLTRDPNTTRESPKVKQAEAQIKAAFAAIRAGKYPDSSNALGFPVRYWRDLLDRPAPPAALQKLTAPALLLHGDADYQVGAVDYALLEGALKRRGKVPYEAQRFPKLNHLFFAVTAPSDGKEYRVAGRMAKIVPATIATWVKAQTKEGPR